MCPQDTSGGERVLSSFKEFTKSAFIFIIMVKEFCPFQRVNICTDSAKPAVRETGCPSMKQGMSPNYTGNHDILYCHTLIEKIKSYLFHLTVIQRIGETVKVISFTKSQHLNTHLLNTFC